MDELIIKHLAFDITSLDFASVKYFAETGQITGNLLVRLRNMLKEASDGKTLNDASALPIPDVSNSVCEICGKPVHPSYNLCFEHLVRNKH